MQVGKQKRPCRVVEKCWTLIENARLGQLEKHHARLGAFRILRHARQANMPPARECFAEERMHVNFAAHRLVGRNEQPVP